MRYLANGITLCRIVGTAGLLWLSPEQPLFWAIYVFCGCSDAADGLAARALQIESDFGARLDSLADLLFAAACFIRILPVMRLPNGILLWTAGIACLRIGNLASGFRRTGRLTVLHTPLNRLTGLLLFLFPIGYRLCGARAAVAVCLIATVTSVQEGFLLRKDSALSPKPKI